MKFIYTVTRKKAQQKAFAEARGCKPCSVRIEEWPLVDGLFGDGGADNGAVSPGMLEPIHEVIATNAMQPPDMNDASTLASVVDANQEVPWLGDDADAGDNGAAGEDGSLAGQLLAMEAVQPVHEMTAANAMQPPDKRDASTSQSVVGANLVEPLLIDNVDAGDNGTGGDVPLVGQLLPADVLQPVHEVDVVNNPATIICNICMDNLFNGEAVVVTGSCGADRFGAYKKNFEAYK